MATISRTKLLLVAIALLIGFAAWPRGSQAASGGSVKPLSTDTAITSTSSSVTVSNAFPDGNTTANCFIQVNSKSGAQTNTFGNCAGATVTVQCASGSYDISVLAPSGTGASTSINSTATWTGAYDMGTQAFGTCPNAPSPAVANGTLSVSLSGTAAGQNVVWLVGGDNNGHFGDATSTQRNGIMTYMESAGNSTPGTIATDYKNKPGAEYYEVTAQGTSGTLVETADTVNHGDVTVQGVFLEAPGQGAQPTNTPGGPTNTPAPTPTNTPLPPGPTIGARLVQFAADSTLATSSSGVTSSQAFPDGGTTAACFIKVTTKSGPQTTTFGNCSGFTLNMTCSSFQFASTPTADQHGAAVVEPSGTRDLSGAYDNGPSCPTVKVGSSLATLVADVTGVTAGTRLVFWWNNDTSASRDGCVAYKEASGSAVPACLQNIATGLNGAYYEIATVGTSGTAYQYRGGSVGAPPQGQNVSCPGNCFASGNLTLGGVFIGATGGGLPLSAQLAGGSKLHGLTGIHWYSPLKAHGVNHAIPSGN
jgi:hypothetical protein